MCTSLSQRRSRTAGGSSPGIYPFHPRVAMYHHGIWHTCKTVVSSPRQVSSLEMLEALRNNLFNVPLSAALKHRHFLPRPQMRPLFALHPRNVCSRGMLGCFKITFDGWCLQ